MSIEERIAGIIRGHELTDKPTWANERLCACGASVECFFINRDHAAHVAAVVVACLGLTEFTCDNERWWSTQIEPIAEHAE